ncbi:MAG: hypothetical protein KAW12_22900 [Candidatus Aminicenantes bacterium]|nr:hypothetical protein [Candidatus Aminicenantes bacterium]
MAIKATTTTDAGGGHLFAVRLLEKFIQFIKTVMTGNLLDFSIKWLTKIGHIALIVAAGVGFFFFVIAGIRVQGAGIFVLYAFGWVIGVFVVQYTAYRFSNAGDDLIANNSTQMSSKAFLDCFGFIAMLAGVVLFFFYIYMAIKVGSLQAFLMGLGLLIFCEFVALIAFNAGTVTMEVVKETSAGQEAIGIATFFMKTLLRLVPIAFGIGIVVFTIMMFIHSFGLFSAAKMNRALFNGVGDATFIVYFGFLPLISYLVFILFFLVVDVIRSILAIPGRIK